MPKFRLIYFDCVEICVESVMLSKSRKFRKFLFVTNLNLVFQVFFVER